MNDEVLDGVEVLYENLRRISFKPSCLDFGWGWKVEPIFDCKASHNGYLIYSGFDRPDTHTGVLGKGWGRAWYVSMNYEGGNCKELAMTAWMAIGQIVEHERLEAFSFDGVRLFNPHKSLEELAYPEKFERPVTVHHHALSDIVQHFG